VFNKDTISFAKKISFVKGTPGFMAPELRKNTFPTTACDVFSFGILMWQVLSKETMPFPGLHIHSIIFQVFDCPW
jgi:serine/threonine protein kinase